jgi:cytochrome c oxidase subunit 4
MEESESVQRKRPNYLAVFIALAVLTGLEILVTQLPVPRLLFLLPLTLAKAALVALFYMHLRFDRRIFSTVFAMGLVMGILLIFSLVALFSPQELDVK